MMATRAKSRKRNPVKGAAALSEAFHGRPAESVTEYVDELREHSVLTDFGGLVALYLSEDDNFFNTRRKPNNCTKITFKGTRLCYTPPPKHQQIPKRQQIYFVGGDQRVDLSAFPVDLRKESVKLGPVAFIEYETAKFHLGKSDKTPGPYIHPFSEESKGELPDLCYDTVNDLCSLVGGSYYVEIDMDGKYSAGIRD